MRTLISTLRRLLAVMPASASRFLALYATQLGLLSILDAAALGLLALIITPLIAGTPARLPLIGEVDSVGLLIALGVVCALIIVKGALTLLLVWIAARRMARYELLIGNQLLDAYLKAPWVDRLSRNSSDLIRIADIGIANTISGFVLPIATLPGELMTFVVVLIVLSVTQPLVAAISLVYLGLVAVVLYFWISRRASEAGSVGLRYSMTVSRLITEMVGALKEITLRDKVDEVAEVVRENRVHTARARANIQILGNVPRVVLEAALIGGFVLVGAASYLTGGLAAAVTAISLFALAGFRLVPSIQRFQNVLTQVTTAVPYVETVVTDILDARATRVEAVADETAVAEIESPRMLSLERVGFRYPGAQQWAVHDVSLSIPFGSTAAIVGASGSGKSTLIDLLLGLIQPEQGIIAVDGTPLPELTRWWRARVGYVPQEVSLFDASVAQNVALSWSDDVDRDRVVAALEQAQLLATIEARFGGIDGGIGERGLSLSGGQRQRLGIARALYAQPLVLVLDEATSALDTATEASVTEAISSLRGRVTTITVAHRLATIQHSDQIFFMSEGVLAAHGTFDELVAANPEFARQAELAGLTGTWGD
ncbi:MAG: ABC transporter ATP-binding protein [Microbacterium sp.]|nr:ABC transporter ATP-binding protein [Microbacterium sp.]MBA4346868.1 ABC transporter ATP-binding protein [Microbacterium sp.]